MRITDCLYAAYESCPDDLAVRDIERSWSWREILDRATIYRDSVRNASLDNAVAVPIIVDRSAESIAAILGVLLAGHAFSPLSPHQPDSRLNDCLIALNCRHVVVLPGSLFDASRCSSAGIESIIMAQEGQSVWEPPAARTKQSLLYVLFTSGSTGTPKGVKVSFGNIENTLVWSTDFLDWNDRDVMGNVAPFFFDISMFDLFAAIYFRVPIAVLSNPSDIHATLDEIERFGVTSIFSAPLFFSQFTRTGTLADTRLDGLRRIVSGGDFFPPAHVLSWMEKRPKTTIWNVWGPTETSIVNTMHRISAGDESLLRNGNYSPVGRQHPRMPFVLLDEDRNEVQPGNLGEICMLGDCVTLGYLADRTKTEASYFDWGGRRAFGTKDLGYIDEIGDLFMTGRIGSTVKIGGYRIDLGEVESAAARIPHILLSGAFVHESEPGMKQLHLAIELRDPTQNDTFAIKQELRKLLPAYMVPKRIFILGTLPRSANGKIRRSALAELTSGVA